MILGGFTLQEADLALLLLSPLSFLSFSSVTYRLSSVQSFEEEDASASPLISTLSLLSKTNTGGTWLHTSKSGTSSEQRVCDECVVKE